MIAKRNQSLKKIVNQNVLHVEILFVVTLVAQRDESILIMAENEFA
jgi:hypothetical protein